MNDVDWFRECSLAAWGSPLTLSLHDHDARLMSIAKRVSPEVYSIDLYSCVLISLIPPSIRK